MRTTVTLDPDVEAILRKVMRERGVSFKEALNQSVRPGTGAAQGEKQGRGYRQMTYGMGFRAEFRWDKALAMANAIEDEEIVRKLQLGK
jgi:hypothetical protein